jgi:3-oxoacyl-[acyl-carrier-protein] synthase II
MALLKLSTRPAAAAAACRRAASTLPPLPPARPRRRVVVTGLGLVTPLGVGVPHVWPRLLAGEHGMVALAGPEWAHFPCRVVAPVPRGPAAGQWDAARHIDRAALRTMSPDYIAFAVAAAGEALADAGLVAAGGKAGGGGEGAGALDAAPLGPYSRTRVGVAIGTGIGGIEEIGATAALAADASGGGLRRVSPFFVPRILVNMAAGNVSIAWGLAGPNTAASTACATGAHAIGDAFRLIQHGDADAMVAGGAEACIGPLALAGFSRAKALATRYNDHPAAASRPFDAGRDGFILGEGAGVVVLEEAEAAAARGARVYAEVRGYGLAGDAWHITSPRPDGSGALRCMAAALAEGGLQAHHVDYVNAHATSTPVGDGVEAAGLASLFREGRAAGGGGGRVAVSSTKGAIGHLLGAAGAVEAVFSILAVHTGWVPPTLNLTHPDAALPTGVCDFPAAPAAGGGTARGVIRAALSNSFGFGGTNASLLFAAPPAR